MPIWPVEEIVSLLETGRGSSPSTAADQRGRFLVDDFGSVDAVFVRVVEVCSGWPSVVDATLLNDHRDDIPPPQRLATVTTRSIADEAR
jgi:hypothetical protein